MRTANKDGYIYVIASGDMQKVGITSNMERRMSAIKCANPDAELIYQSPLIGNKADIERHIHKKIRNIHYKGEWFDGDADDVVRVVSNAVNKMMKNPNDEDIDDDAIVENSILQATGILSKVLSKQDDILFRYKSDMKKTCSPDEIEYFCKKHISEQYLLAASYYAKRFISSND